ncbi:MAG TPA: hypothetical protein VJT14_06640, partial [Candidatus Dormibacteraeota bacterium]|nr:hypothetical protein [Candidatus Dormibacteraeota bacterium]
MRQSGSTAEAEERSQTIQWRGALSAEEKHRVEQAVRRGINRGTAASRPLGDQRGDAASSGLSGAPPVYDPLTSTIKVPSFRDGGAPVQVAVPRQREPVPADEAEELKGPYTLGDVARIIRASFPESDGRPGPGFYYGVYVSLVGVGRPYLYYLRVDEAQHEVVEAIRLDVLLKGQRGALRLEPGYYTVTFEPHGRGTLDDLTRRARSRMGNPDDMDLRVSFVVDSQGGAPVAPDKPRYRFYPRVHLLRLNEETPIATGSESVYAAVVDMWRVDEHWRPTKISFIAFIGTFPDFRWEVRRLTKPQDPHDEGELVRVEDGKDDYLRHTWDTEGEYRITCQVKVDHPDTSPAPVHDQVHERVILLEKKMATLLALYEIEEAKPDQKRIWYRSIDDRITELTDQLKAEKAKATPNQALIDALQGAIDKINKELAPWVGLPRQPFPIHAVFTDQKTSRTQPVHLFLSFGLRAELTTSWVCHLIDLTYEPFYRTYEGLGLTPHEAMRAAFETSRKTLKRNYPPGHIWARVSKDDLERQGLAVVPGFHEWEFMTETESWEKEAYEWINLAVQVVGVTALLVSFVFPPSLVITGALVVTGLVGAAVSIANIVERVESNDFGWDLETFSDIANIAAAMVGLGAAAAEVRAGALARTLASAEEASGQAMAKLAGAAEKAGAKAAGGIASEAETLTLTKLASLAKLQRVMVLTGLGMDVANLLILGYGTYSELKMIDAYADEERQDLIRQYG